MPEFNRFYGVRIKMYYDDHNPPYFHAEYAEDEALIAIDTVDTIAGVLPSRALGLIYEMGGEASSRTERGVDARGELGADRQNRAT